ncbi:MAG: Holliday junction resolvase RuvX [Candidatus Margulisbacteria bacterium]|nr:Holliday junction resolvase RuvX [Candidatus Margulisiibacteriota bacterium]
MVRIIGIDYGEKRIGVAASDPLLITAQGVATVKDLQELKNVIGRYDDVQEIVVGLPRSMDGSLGIAAQKVLAFIETLKAETGFNVVSWDERLTTAAAERMLISAGVSREKRKKVIDKSAAAGILQSYLDRKKK